jgi:hypothetical protein
MAIRCLLKPDQTVEQGAIDDKRFVQPRAVDVRLMEERARKKKERERKEQEKREKDEELRNRGRELHMSMVSFAPIP